jgi:hypothetical protein
MKPDVAVKAIPVLELVSIAKQLPANCTDRE